jgi:DnaJ like chaperone protein
MLAVGSSRSHAHESVGVTARALTELGISARLALIDGPLTREEYAICRTRFREQVGDTDALPGLFDSACHSPLTVEFYARQLAYDLRHPRARIRFFRHLCQLATSDGWLNQKELELLLAIGGWWNLPDFLLQHLLTPYMAGKSANPWEILELTQGASSESIRLSYHRFARHYHPDQLVTAGLPEWVLKHYERQFAIVSSFYRQSRRQMVTTRRISLRDWWQRLLRTKRIAGPVEG